MNDHREEAIYYKGQRVEGLNKTIVAAALEAEELQKKLEEVRRSGVEFDDARLDYVTVQIVSPRQESEGLKPSPSLQPW